MKISYDETIIIAGIITIFFNIFGLIFFNIVGIDYNYNTDTWLLNIILYNVVLLNIINLKNYGKQFNR